MSADSADSAGFGLRLRACRLAAGLSQHSLAQRSGLSIRMIRDLERGRTRWPYPDSLTRLADALELSGQHRADFVDAVGRRFPAAAASPSRRPGSSGRRISQAAPRQLPPPVPGFVGRDSQLAELSRMLEQPGGTATISAIGGMAGVGKTALAVRWAHRVAAEFPDGQLYVNLRGFDSSAAPVSTTDAVRGFLDALGVAASQLPATSQAQLGLYRSLLAGRRILVVLDNARDAAQVRPLLPGSPTCRVVVTSRNQLAGLAAIDAARPLVLNPLTEGEARQLLTERLGEGRIAGDPDAAAQIIGACAHLPLALTVIAARAALTPQLPLRLLAADLAGREDLAAFAGHPAAPVDLRTAFSWSYRQLSADLRRVFRFASLHPGPDLEPHAMAALAGTSVAQAARDLDALARVCMIQFAGPATYGLHDLLRGYAAELTASCDSAEQRREAVSSLLAYYLQVVAQAMDAAFPAERHRRPAVAQPAGLTSAFASEAQAMAWLRSQRANLIAAIMYGTGHGWPGEAARLAELLFRYLDVDAQFADAISIYRSVHRAARGVGDVAAQAASVLNLGNIYLHQGHYRQGIARLGEALSLLNRTADVTGQARALAGLGVGNLLLGQPALAVTYLERSLALHRQRGDQIGEARALANLAFAALRQGRYPDAGGYLRDSLAICRDAGDLRGHARALANLGEVELQQDHYDEAASYLTEALDSFRLMGDRTSAADAVASLGITTLRQGRKEQALDYLRQALATSREVGEVSRQALALNGLGEVLLAMDRPARARAHYTAALTLAAQAGEKYEQARAHEGLAATYQASGVGMQARRHWTEALARYSDLGAPEAERVRDKLRVNSLSAA
jgi:tetratricopeptide (TPR) repeat protein/transcriptional regulator with XRE-family HTH domain